ncbi:ANL family adenylate-forming protein [Maribacter sp. Asnod2-G09]|uniref:ANL family adenylate-forming protein n=1 Tax=Maribacter sp. Asnod2-G09 TaxID=3160577 RepID=UPI0038662DBE
MIELIKKYEGECITDLNGSYTFSELVDQINEFKNQLSNKIRNHDRVLIYSDYTFHSISLLVSLSNLNINIIPLVKTTEAEYQEKVESVYPNLILSFDDNNKLITKNSTLTPNKEEVFNDVSKKGDTGIILFSSGTTGKPKVMIQNLTKIISSIKTPRRQKSLRFIILLMFDHIGGLNTLFNCLINGSPFVIPQERSPSLVISLINKHQINILPTTPTFLNLLMIDESFDSSKLKSLKLITYGTERMSEVMLNKLNLNLPKVKLLQTFGTSETGILKTQSKSSNSLFFKIIDEEKKIKIVGDELYLRSKTQVNGYVNHNNDSFLKNGWYATGDIVETDKDGYIKIIGRKNKVINVGGLKVLPKEIEDVINLVNGVDDSTVFSELNNLVGNIVCAKIFTQLENTKELKLEIKSVCRKNLDKYKVPVKLYFEKLEMTKRGKKC